MSMDTFNKAYQYTRGNEGGYLNDADGETYRGILRNNWPNWEGWKIFDIYKHNYPINELNEKLAINDNLQIMVKNFYLKNYWIPLHLDAFHETVAIEMFDTGVNQGKHAVSTYLQQALNILNRNKQDYPDMVVDGKIGAITLRAYKSYMATQRFSSRNIEKLLRWLVRWLNYYQLKRYDLITTRDPSQEKNIPGWTERA